MDIRQVIDGESFKVEINDWWANARYREIKKSISLKEKTNLVDIGCGSAQNLFFIDRDYPHLELLGVDHERRRISYNWLSDRIEIIPDIQQKVFDADVYLLMDVLEHLPNDNEFLSKIVENAKYGSTFFLSVPSFPILWSQRDEEVGHYRRYTKSSLKRLCIDAGITIELCHYKFWFLFLPLFLLKKKVSSIGITNRPWGASSALARMSLGVLSRLEEAFPRLPFGTSIILVGNKK